MKTGYQILRQIRKNYARICPGPMRPFDDGGMLDTNKAIEYARWIAKRDKIKLDNTTHVNVRFRNVKLEGFNKPIKRAISVSFGSVRINLPHVYYDPTIPAKELKNTLDIRSLDFKFKFKDKSKPKFYLDVPTFDFNFKKVA